MKRIFINLIFNNCLFIPEILINHPPKKPTYYDSLIESTVFAMGTCYRLPIIPIINETLLLTRFHGVKKQDKEMK